MPRILHGESTDLYTLMEVTDGSVAIDFVYDLSTGFSADGSYAFVQYEGLWGAIDTDGNWLIPAKFKEMQRNYSFIQN